MQRLEPYWPTAVADATRIARPQGDDELRFARPQGSDSGSAPEDDELRFARP
jgi:hypothetical protein